MSTHGDIHACAYVYAHVYTDDVALVYTHANTQEHTCLQRGCTCGHTCPYIHSYTHAKFGQGVFRRMDVAAWVYCLSVIAAFIAERVFFFTQPVTATAEKTG